MVVLYLYILKIRRILLNIGVEECSELIGSFSYGYWSMVVLNLFVLIVKLLKIEWKIR